MKAKRFLATVLSICLAVLTLFSFVGCGVYGEFYNLDEAYNNGWITFEDLKSIAYYNQGTWKNEGIIGEDFSPKPKKELKKRLEKKINLDFAKILNKDFYTDEYNDKNTWIEMYYGTYNSCVVVKQTGHGIVYGQSVHFLEFDGLIIYNENGNGDRIKVWREKQ